LLYCHRDESEARFFIDNLFRELQLNKNSKVLDLACGKGRHSVYLAQKKIHVTGIDLSLNNISEASKHENSHLSFFTHDMRNAFPFNNFDVVLNLFTSFGYFENEKENIKVLESVSKALVPKGKLVIDFFNLNKVKECAVPFEEKEIAGVKFTVKREIENNFIAKIISVSDKHEKHHFEDIVLLLSLNDFEKYFSQTGFKIINLFGDYSLKPFDETHSDRLIIIAEKNN
jgi:SAM-dependent methyltransferase